MKEHLSPALEWILFLTFSGISIVFAFFVLRTMSMVRAGLYLMVSFCAIAGLFLVLSADLIASMQIMMYVGGMLVMILFMVMMSMDPGGAMMGIAPPEPDVDEMQQMHRMMQANPYAAEEMQHMMQGQEEQQNGHSSHMQEQEEEKQHSAGQRQNQPQPYERSNQSSQQSKTQLDQEHGGMKHGGSGMMMDMSMTNEFTRPAAVMGTLIAAALVAAVAVTNWPDPQPLGRTDSAVVIGQELLGRYMIAFEGAAILIILGVTAAVIFGRKE